MPEFPTSVWFLIAIAGLGGVLAMLNYLASSVRNQQIVHDFKVEIQQLQSNYLRILKEQQEIEQAISATTTRKKKRAA